MPLSLLCQPPHAGVDDITAVVIILLEGNPKDKSWGAAQKLMNNVDKFLERLRGFKAVIDQGKVCAHQWVKPAGRLPGLVGLRVQHLQEGSHLCCSLMQTFCAFVAACSQLAKKTVEACRSYLELPHFNKEIIFNKSRAAAGLCEWAINIVKYFDVVSEVEPKRQELAAANAKLHEANTTLAAVQQKVTTDTAVVVLALAGAAGTLNAGCCRSSCHVACKSAACCSAPTQTAL